MIINSWWFMLGKIVISCDGYHQKWWIYGDFMLIIGDLCWEKMRFHGMDTTKNGGSMVIQWYLCGKIVISWDLTTMKSQFFPPFGDALIPSIWTSTGAPPDLHRTSTRLGALGAHPHHVRGQAAGVARDLGEVRLHAGDLLAAEEPYNVKPPTKKIRVLPSSWLVTIAKYSSTKVSTVMWVKQ